MDNKKIQDTRTDTQVLLDWLVRKIVRNSEIRGVEINASDIVSDIIQKTYIPYGLKIVEIENNRNIELQEAQKKYENTITDKAAAFLNKKKRDEKKEKTYKEINNKYNDQLTVETGRFILKCDEIDEQLKYTGIKPLHEMFNGFSPAVPKIEQRVRISLLMCQDQLKQMTDRLEKQGIFEKFKEPPSKDDIRTYMENSVERQIQERNEQEKKERNIKRLQELGTEIDYTDPRYDRRAKRPPPDFGL